MLLKKLSQESIFLSARKRQLALLVIVFFCWSLSLWLSQITQKQHPHIQKPQPSIPKQFQYNSQIISKQFPKNSKRIPKKIPISNSQRIQKKNPKISPQNS